MDRLFIGCMTGTSIDAIDVALVRTTGVGLNITARIEQTATHPLGDLIAPLRALAFQQPMPSATIANLSHLFATAHIEAIRRIFPNSNAPSVAGIVVHGQTIFHDPPCTWQLISPAPIAAQFQTRVLFDLRVHDLAAGGRGAPITPIADFVFFRHDTHPRAIVNLGGFCNITLLPIAPRDATSAALRMQADEVSGGDICACNHVLDGVARRVLHQDYDRDGQAACSGQLHPAAFEALCTTLAGQARQKRALGTGDESTRWLNDFAATVAPADLARTACEAIAATIVRQIPPDAQILLAGGGVKNRALQSAITSRFNGDVKLTDDLAVPAQYREAACMAVLGALAADDEPATLPRITGARVPCRTGIWCEP